MKLGINLLCLAGVVGREHLPALERLKEIGYDGVDVPVLAGDVEHYRWLGDELDRIGLERTTTSIVPAPEANPVSGDASVRAKGVKHLDWALDCAIAMGAQCVGGPFHAPIGHFTGSGPTEEELALGADAHRAMADRAAGHGIVLSLEPLNRFETYFLNTMEQARAYAERVGHPHFGIMYDTFHAHIEEQSQIRAVETIAGHITVLHVSENDRGIPGRGQIDFPAVFSAVKRTGFDGWVVMEAFGSGLPEIAAATRIWRPLFPDFETLFTEGHDFIRRTWAAA